MTTIMEISGFSGRLLDISVRREGVGGWDLGGAFWVRYARVHGPPPSCFSFSVSVFLFMSYMRMTARLSCLTD